MSTLRVATIETENELTDLTLKTGNTSGPQITIYSGNGQVEFTSISGMTFGGSSITYSANVTYSGLSTFSGNTTYGGNVTYAGTSTFTGNSVFNGATVTGNVSYGGTVTYTGNADFSSANVSGNFGITTGKAIAMAIVFG